MSATTLTPEARREQTRRALLASAEALFLEHGYHQVTLDGVAEGAGMTKGAIYSNFDSKADLFFAVLEERAQAALERYSETVLAESDLDSAIAAVSAVADPLRPDWEQSLLELEARALAARDPEVRERLVDLQRRQVARIADLLTAVSEQLGLPLARPVEQSAALALAATAGLADLARIDPEADLDERFESLVEMLARHALVT
ncbi:MAG TPA: helix-turn-helix domain-containing protein [Nitriliruptorales bacterium]|jgi:AcrR family transcriptional regulator